MGRHKTISDDTVLAAARGVFLKNGYAASTREIARVAGVSETVLYQRFKSKDALFYAAMVPSAPDFMKVLGPIEPPDQAHAYVRSAVDRMAGFFTECLPLGLQVMMHPRFDAAAFAEAQQTGVAQQLEEELALRLRRLQQRHLITRTSARSTARLLTSLAHDWAVRNVLSDLHARRTRHDLQAAVDVVWQGLAPTPSRRPGRSRASGRRAPG